MEENNEFETMNVSELWIKNIFENIKNLEFMERLAREGCESIQDYMQIPIQNREIEIPMCQYKNLKMMVSEMLILLGDASPILDENFLKEKISFLNKTSEHLEYSQLFIKSRRTTNRKIRAYVLTEQFYKTSNVIYVLRAELINKIAPILFVGKIKDKGEKLK